MSLELDELDVAGGTGVNEYVTDDDREGCELVDGVWVEKEGDMAGARVDINLAFVLEGFVRANRLGGVVLSGTARYQLFPTAKNIRMPDVSFVAAGRFPGNVPPRGRIRLAPDLAVEVHSPTDLVEYTEIKRDEYLRAGVRQAWEVHIPTRNVWVYKPDGTAKLYRVTDTLSGDDVLPGFAVPVAELFNGLDPLPPATDPAGPPATSS